MVRDLYPYSYSKVITCPECKLWLLGISSPAGFNVPGEQLFTTQFPSGRLMVK